MPLHAAFPPKEVHRGYRRGRTRIEERQRMDVGAELSEPLGAEVQDLNPCKQRRL